jgi:hypothetical protein
MKTKVSAAVVVMLAAARAAVAQSNPTFAYGKPEEVKGVEWKVQAKGGLLLTAGNSQTTNGTFSMTASRKQDGNRLALEGGVAYGKSNVLVPVYKPNPTMDPTMVDVVTGLNRQSVTTTNTWLAKGRYDRFFTANNSGFVSAFGSGDQIAGKAFVGGGQVGYSRQLHKTDANLLVAELGYDFSYERYVQQAGKPPLEPVSIHSARAFVADTLKLSPETGATASVEALFNLNKENAALNVDTGMSGVDTFKDTRVNGKLGLTTTVHKSLSVGLGLTLKYDQNPAPRPLPSGLPSDAKYDSAFQPFANKLDTLAEATLIYTFL